MTTLQKRLLIGLLIMALLSPLGIILPEILRAGDAWGEWGTDAINEMLGYIPEGMKRLENIWKAPVPDYNFGSEDSNLTMQIIFYILAGLLGIGFTGGTLYLITRLIVKRRE